MPACLETTFKTSEPWGGACGSSERQSVGIVLNPGVTSLYPGENGWLLGFPERFDRSSKDWSVPSRIRVLQVGGGSEAECDAAAVSGPALQQRWGGVRKVLVR